MSVRDIDYLKASLKASLDLRSKMITFHEGEKGRFNENQVRKFLRRLLPGKMELGTGFIACADSERTISPQQDIIIYDSVNNVPLFHDEMFDIFPVESVYGTVEVKTTLDVSELEKSLVANRKIRDMAEHTGKYYLISGTSETSPGSGEFISTYFEVKETVPPRFFMFCYSCNWVNFQTLEENFIRLSKQINAHCHGLYILDKDWFICRNAYNKNESGAEQVAFARDANGFAIFSSRVPLALNSMQIAQANLKRYEEKKLAQITATDTNGNAIPVSLNDIFKNSDPPWDS
jgi:hypothetical protein